MTDPDQKATIVRSYEDPLTGDHILHLSDGRMMALDRRALERNPLAWWLETLSISGGDGRVDVIQYGRKVGELPAYWHPGLAKSKSFLYDYRPGDLQKVDGKWVASETLGGGDLDCLIGFVRKDQGDD